MTITAGRLKDAGSPTRPMTEEEKKLFKDLLADVHSQFRAAVQERRKLTNEELDHWADGRVMTGSQAKAAKLVDELGGIEEAIAAAKKEGKLSDTADVVYPDDHEGLLKKLIFGDSDSEENRFTNALENLTRSVPDISPGWRVMFLAPVR